MNSDLEKLAKNIEKAVAEIKKLRKENAELKKEKMFLSQQVKAISDETAISAKSVRELERMKMERMKIRDRIGVLLGKLDEVK